MVDFLFRLESVFGEQALGQIQNVAIQSFDMKNRYFKSFEAFTALKKFEIALHHHDCDAYMESKSLEEWAVDFSPARESSGELLFLKSFLKNHKWLKENKPGYNLPKPSFVITTRGTPTCRDPTEEF